MAPRWAGGRRRRRPGGGGGIIFPGHPGPIPNAPRDDISRKGIPSLRLLKLSLNEPPETSGPPVARHVPTLNQDGAMPSRMFCFKSPGIVWQCLKFVCTLPQGLNIHTGVVVTVFPFTMVSLGPHPFSRKGTNNLQIST